MDGLFNSHIAIFGNTGSGKSNTLAFLYQEFISVLRKRNEDAFTQNVRIVLLDFNGEFTSTGCISAKKKVYNLSTRKDNLDKLPIKEDAILNIEVASILADASEKTQKPFLRRAIGFYRKVMDSDDPQGYLRNTLKRRVMDVYQMSDKVRAFLVLDYFREILPPAEGVAGSPLDLASDVNWHNKCSEFYIRGTDCYLGSSPHKIPDTRLYKHVDNLTLEDSLLSRVLVFLYLQLISDILANRAQNEHVVYVINRLKARKVDIDRVFDMDSDDTFWQSNVVVVNLADVNLEMKKTLPLLLAKKLYTEQKETGQAGSLSIVIDEAHNILSTESFREAENWKDYRLETFEEIIKEGRKFGVFVTISSQRPNDISPTITSQAHNYFIHRLLNERDLKAIASAVSSQHGYGIARRIERLSGDEILLNQGTMYAALVRLHRRGWISAEWGASENNHKAKFYSITKRGAKQLAGDGAYWQRLVRVIGRVLAEPQEDKTSPNPAAWSLIGLTPLSKSVPRFLASHEGTDREPALPKERR